MSSANKALVYDIGLHHGDDSAYYLEQGFKVVGVDANPVLVAKCAQRFSREIQENRITLVNAGVLSGPGDFTFYRNLTDDGWSSFVPERGKAGGKFEAIQVGCVTLRALIEQHGQPFFIKTDVEGMDLDVIDSLDATVLPAYISCELTPATSLLERLISLGYKRFKLVNGETFTTGAPIFPDEPGWRMLRKLGRLLPPARMLLRALPPDWHRKSEFETPGWHCPVGTHNSGPFGEEAFGNWEGAEKTMARLRSLIEKYQRSGTEHQFWWDVHARFSGD